MPRLNQPASSATHAQEEETSMRVRPPDRRRLFAVGDHCQGWRLRHPEDGTVGSALDGDLAR